jgi:phage terminase large subunit
VGHDLRPAEREIGKPTIVPFVLFERQEAFLDWLLARWQGREDGLVEKSRDMGVSWLCVAFAVWMWLYQPGSVVGFGSRKEEEYVDKIGDPKSLFWKVRQFINLLPVEFRPAGGTSKHAPHMRVLNPENGASIVGEAGDNIGRGNRTSIYFKDESAFYEHADAIDAALSQTSNCKIDVSTPNGAGNAFYRKRHGGKIKVFVFDWNDDPRKGKDWYAKQCEILDAVIVAQEIDRDYESSVSDSWIPATS